MGEHQVIMEQMRMTRSDYLRAIRKAQPMNELRRKAEKSARRKGKIWTQEQIDLIAAEAVDLLTKFAAAPMTDD